jgi:DNA-binding transcriptional ArsR family regulator
VRTNAKAIAGTEASAPVFAALGNRTRLRLVSQLCCGGPATITRLTADFKMTRQAITKHLRVMEEAGLVRNTRRGRESFWRLEHRRIQDARSYLAQIAKQWDETLGRLRKFVEA